ncbi:aminoglycoside 2''-phosphotransferase [Paenibacillus sp. UNCCL117]|uniref:phosphotransferase family protein n=1 Tax=unclassified Paenibacillus TaxID=185978 RepID=UPI000888ED9C|nr:MULTISPECIES: phosphotransferase [unclassified Paenibacillus]SDE41542.1 aminoglycoside 2''-phosphotransferase [Paenibacillus sp. cl123]SFW65503.1 aminoglycoside 2''-phosphotransferase [Paenibacillus sp. UNCCL117]
MTKHELDDVKRTIETQFPGIGLLSVESLGEGYRNYALLVNGEWVFRFPKSQQGADELHKEIQLLPLLASRLNVGIPVFEFVGRQNDGRPFVGYRKVQGEILGENGISSLSGEASQRLAAQLAAFMHALGEFPVETAIAADVPVRNLNHEVLELLESAKIEAFPVLPESLQHYIARRCQTYLDDPPYSEYTPALIHGDLSPDHFLTDPSKTALTGIIDFGDAAISDPDYDYVYLLEDCGETFTRQVMTCRGVLNQDALIRKVSFFVTFDQISYLVEGVRSGEKEWICEALEILEEDARVNKDAC